MEVSRVVNEFYPDLIADGGLSGTLQSALRKTRSTLNVSELDKTMNFIVHSRVERRSRFSQIYIASKERLFLFDFWARGVCLANAQTPDIDEVAVAIDMWVTSTCTTADLAAACKCVVVNEKAKVYERGDEVKDRWNTYLESIRFPELEPFVKAAFQREKLKQLFPSTSLNMFCFSRCTGYPFTRDIPHVCPVKNLEYQVVSPSGEILGQGDAEHAADLVVANLPPDCGPAVPGTAEDLLPSKP